MFSNLENNCNSEVFTIIYQFTFFSMVVFTLLADCCVGLQYRVQRFLTLSLSPAAASSLLPENATHVHIIPWSAAFTQSAPKQHKVMVSTNICIWSEQIKQHDRAPQNIWLQSCWALKCVYGYYQKCCLQLWPGRHPQASKRYIHYFSHLLLKKIKVEAVLLEK